MNVRWPEWGDVFFLAMCILLSSPYSNRVPKKQIVKILALKMTIPNNSFNWMECILTRVSMSINTNLAEMTSKDHHRFFFFCEINIEWPSILYKNKCIKTSKPNKKVANHHMEMKWMMTKAIDSIHIYFGTWSV